MTEYDFSPEAEAAYHEKLQDVGEWANVQAVPTIHSRARSHSQAYAHSQRTAPGGGFSSRYAGSQGSLAQYELLTPPSRAPRSHSRSNSYASSNTSRPVQSHETRMTSPPPPSHLSQFYHGAHYEHGVQKTTSVHSVYAANRAGGTLTGVQQHAPAAHFVASPPAGHGGGHARSRSMSMSMSVSSHPYGNGYPHPNVYPDGYQNPSAKGYAHPQPYPTPYSPPGGMGGLLFSPSDVPQTNDYYPSQGLELTGLYSESQFHAHPAFENRTATAISDGKGKENQNETESLISKFKGKKRLDQPSTPVSASKPKQKSTPLFEITYMWRMGYTWRYTKQTQAQHHLLIRRLHTGRKTSSYMVIVPSRYARAIPWSDNEHEYVLVKPGESVTILDPPHPGLMRELTTEEWAELVSREDVEDHRPVVFQSHPGRKLNVRKEDTTSVSPHSLTSASGKGVGRGVRFGDNFFRLLHPGDSVTVVRSVEGMLGKGPMITFSKATWGYLDGQGRLVKNGKDEYAPLDLHGRTEFDDY